MARIRLIHWHADEAKVRAEQLRLEGYDVACDLPEPPVLLRQLRSDPPSAVIIDLSRVPSRGRDVAVALRTYKDTRAVPLVLVGGDPDKLARVRELLPDAGRIRRNALWIAWPKKAASPAIDLTQQAMREAGLAAGLVDYKICSIDETWSALLFRRRKG